DRKSTRLNSSHVEISYAVFCLKKKIVLYEAVAGHYRVAIRGREAHSDPVVRETILLDEDVAGVFGDFHADVTGFNGARLHMEMRGAHQDGRRPAIAQHQAFERGVGAGDVEHRCIGNSLRVD